MEITITKQHERLLLHRQDVEARIAFEGATPTKKEAVAAVAKAMKAKPELTIVRSVNTVYGTTTGKITASVYADTQALERGEHESMRKRHVFQTADVPSDEKPADASATDEGAEAPTDEKPAANSGEGS